MLGLVACGGPDAVSASDSSLDSGIAKSADTGTAGFAVSGTVLDLDGNPAVDLFVTVSTDYCIPDRTDADGRFTVTRVTPGPKRLITYGETASNGRFASLVFAFTADAEFTFPSPVIAPRFDVGWPVDPEAAEDQSITTPDGLVLTIPAGSLTLAPFAPAEIYAARVPVGQAPDFVPEGVDLFDLFALGPIQSTFDPPAPVTFPPGDRVPGTRVDFYSLDYDTGKLAIVATGTVNDEGAPTTDPGQGLTELTWVGVAEE